MVEAVKSYAQENYNNGGWDYVVEAYDKEDIVKAIGAATSIEQAIHNVEEEVGIRDEYRRDIQAEIF